MCESPRNLVENYRTYGHGERTEDHLIVLDANLLPGIENDLNIRIFEPENLLQDFLRTFQDECKVAASLNQPVVLMVFGHRSPDTYGVAVGGRGDPLNVPHLQIKHIIASLRGLEFSLNSPHLLLFRRPGSPTAIKHICPNCRWFRSAELVMAF